MLDHKLGMAACTHSLQHPLLNDHEQDGNTPNAFGREIVAHEDDDDVPPITSFAEFRKQSWIESKKLWSIAGPLMFIEMCKYSVVVVTQTFAGHLGTIELAAMSIEQAAIEGLAFGFMLGMGNAVQTLCGQAFGDGKIHMLGVYVQRSIVVSNVAALVLSLIYIFATPFLRLLGQTNEISHLGGKFAIWKLPLLFATAFNYPIQNFLQSQGKVMAMAWIFAIGLIFHALLSWLCIFKLGRGLAGAAFASNLSWWMMVLVELLYAVRCCPGAWTGLSWLAFRDLWAFVRLSFASAVMQCFGIWYLMMLTVMTGRLKNAAIEVDAVSICMSLNGWGSMIFFGFQAAISVRVSNELGAGHPRAAKFSVIIVVATTLCIDSIFMGVILLFRNKFAVLFTNSTEVIDTVSGLAALLAMTMLLDSLQRVLSGVAIGGGWQALIAYVNLGCYYVVGIPLAFVLGYRFDLGAKGIWCGVFGGIALQTFVILGITYFTNWKKEVLKAKDRLKLWGSSSEALENSSVKRTIHYIIDDIKHGESSSIEVPLHS